MALDFGDNSDGFWVNHGTLGGANPTALTAMVWLYPTVDNVEMAAWTKNLSGGGNGFMSLYCREDGSLLADRDRATTDVVIRSAIDVYTPNKWWFVAFRSDTAGVNGDQNMFVGDLDNLAAEVGSYQVQSVGSGTVYSVAGNDLIMGDWRDPPSGWAEFSGHIGLIALTESYVTLAEIKVQQYALLPVRDDYFFFVNFGWNGAGVQTDWSGGGYNGTVTGATASAHVPLRVARRRAYTPYQVAAALGNPWYAYAQQ